MTDLSTFPSPREIANLLAETNNPAEPASDIASLEEYWSAWPYPRSLDFWEGYVYADLCEQLAWAHFNENERSEALEIWKECPWPGASEGERRVLAASLQSAYDKQTLVIGPAVQELLSLHQLNIGAVLASLESPISTVQRSGCGNCFVFHSSLLQPDGSYEVRAEIDESTVYFMSYLPREVQARLSTARSKSLMGEWEECGSWLLRAASAAHARGMSAESYSMLEKAQQCSPKNSSISRSIENLRAKGVGGTVYSRVLVERALVQPEPLRRCAVRPEQAPQEKDVWAQLQCPQLNGVAMESLAGGRLALSSAVELAQAHKILKELEDLPHTWGLILPSSWKLSDTFEPELLNKRVSAVRGVGMENLGLWKSDYRTILAHLDLRWTPASEVGDSRFSEDFPPPGKVRVGAFSCAEPWQIPTILSLELPELGSEVFLSAWLRRFQKRWGGRAYLLAQDLIWLHLETLPSPAKREHFLTDLMNFSSDVAECFDPSMVTFCEAARGYIVQVPLPLSVSAS